MEPLNDKELNEILREWRAPEAPSHLDARVFATPKPWWDWMLRGSIRVPVPALVLALVALAAIFYFERKPPANSAGLAEFHPVKQLNLRVIRSNYEPH